MTASLPSSSAPASPVALAAVEAPEQPPVTAALHELYRGFEQELLVPLWTEIGDLMPISPRPAARAARVAVANLLAAGRPRPASWCRSAAAASAGRSRWPTRVCAAPRTPRPPCGRRSSTWTRARTPRSTGTPSTRSGSSSRARACGPSSTATRSRCAAATSCSPRAGASTVTTTRPTRRWPGSTDWTSRSSTRSGSAFFEFGPDEVADRSTPAALARRAAVGPPRAAPGLASRGADRELADRRLPLGAHRRRAGRPARAGERGASRRRRAGPRRGPLHQPDDRRRRAAHHPRRDAPAAARAPRPPTRREVGSAVWQVFDGTATVRVGERRVARSTAATCSPCRPGRR